MVLEGLVKKSFIEERELVGKDGVKRNTKVAHVLLLSGKGGDDFEVVNVRSYDPAWELPEVGKTWITPRVRKYESFDGTVAEVSV